MDTGVFGRLVSEHEKITIQSRDGIRLAGRYYHFEDDAPVSIVFHGYRGNVARDACGGFRMSRDNGFNVLLINQRAHFESGGRTITFGVKERYGCLDWIEYVRDRFGKETPIVLMGLSMGAGHGMSYCINSEAYVNAVQKFIDSVMNEE